MFCGEHIFQGFTKGGQGGFRSSLGVLKKNLEI